MTDLPLVTIHPWGSRSLGGLLALRGAASLFSISNNTWPVNNRAFFVPFAIEGPLTVAKLWLANGGVAAGNFDIGIYDAALTKLVSTGSTAQSGTNVLQVVSVGPYRLSAGQFFLALGMSNTSGQALADTNLTTEQLRMVGVFTQESAVALPATATPASAASAFLPLFGLGTKRMV